MRDATVGRRMDAIGLDVRRTHRSGEPNAERAARYAADLNDLAAGRTTAGAVRVDALTPGVIADGDDFAAGRTGPVGILTGLPELDGYTGGFHPGELVVIAASTSRGKSVLLLQCCEASARDGHPAYVASLEMSGHELTRRLFAAVARVPFSRVRCQTPLKPGDAGRLIAGKGIIDGLPLYIDSRPGLTVEQTLAEARRFVRRHGVKLVAVDYVQLVRATNPRDTRQRQVAEITRTLERFAAEGQVCRCGTATR